MHMSQVPHILPNIPRITADARPDALPYEPVCAVFRRYLHKTKLKFTPERAMILDAVLRKEGLFEPEGLIEHLKSLGHRVSRATVYRTLSHLQDAGILKDQQRAAKVAAARMAILILVIQKRRSVTVEAKMAITGNSNFRPAGARFTSTTFDVVR